MNKVHVVLIGNNDGVYGGYVHMRAGEAMAGPIMNALYEIRKRVGTEYSAASSVEEADVVLVIVLVCPCCDRNVGSKISELRRSGKRVVVTTPLDGSSDAGVVYSFKANVKPYFHGFVWDAEAKRETTQRYEGGDVLAGEYERYIIDGTLGALDEELASHVANEGLPTLELPTSTVR